MASPSSKKQPDAVADKVLKRAEVGKVRFHLLPIFLISTPQNAHQQPNAALLDVREVCHR